MPVMQTRPRDHGMLSQLERPKPCRWHKKTGPKARLLALPRLLRHAYYVWRFALKTTLSDEVIRSQ